MPSIKKPPPVEDAAAIQAALERQDREKKMAEERYQFEQRVLTLCTGLVVVIAVLWTVALSTDHWYELDAPQQGLYLRDSRTVLRNGHSGLWRLCSEQFHPANLSEYESITTTVAPVSTTKRPRAQPCKWMGLKGHKRKRCRQIITNKFKFSLAARRRASLARKQAAAARAGNAAPSAAPSAADTAPAPEAAPDAVNATGTDDATDGSGADGGDGLGADDLGPTQPTPVQAKGPDADNLAANNTDSWAAQDFDDTVNAAEDTVAQPDPVDAEVAAEPVDLEQEKFLAMAEDSIKERITDGITDDLTINETLEAIVDEGVNEITAVKFWDCRARELFEDELEPNAATDWRMLSYMKTLLTFSVVSLLLLLLGFLSALYTFKEPRYTFKRLSAGIQFIAGSGLLVVIEVYRSAAAYEQTAALGGVDMAVGYSQVLAWLALVTQFLCAFFFLLYSRKKKRNKAPTEELAMADEPAIIGR